MIEGGTTEGRVHDFFNDRRWLFSLIGFKQSKHPIIYLNRVSLFTFFFYLQSMAAYAMYLNRHDRITMINALHTFLMASFALCGYTSRLLTHKSLNRARLLIVEGIYSYEGEELDDIQTSLLKGTAEDVRRKSVMTLSVCILGAAWNMIFFPVSQLFMWVEEAGDHSTDTVNPYLPLVFHNPFNTRSVLGYSAAYLIGVLLFVFIYGVCGCMNEIFVSCVVQMKVHLQILNQSLRNIEKRALVKFKNSCTAPLSSLKKANIFEEKEFQRCLYSCFKANIQHHQALIRFYKEWQTFCGACLLALLTVGCIVYASFIFLILQKLPINFVVCYLVTLFTELFYPYYNCLFGEEVVEECGRMFQELYGLPWIHCDKTFTRTLAIVMSNVIQPIKIQALILNASASLETYGDLISAAYKAANLIRQSEKH